MNLSNATITHLSALALLALALTGCRSHDFPQYPPNYREYAYVTNSGGNTVTVLDVVDVRVDRELVVGQKPVAVASSPTRDKVYVVNSGAAEGQARFRSSTRKTILFRALFLFIASRSPSRLIPPAIWPTWPTPAPTPSPCWTSRRGAR